MKYIKFSALDIVEWQNTEIWLVSYVTCGEIIAQVSVIQRSTFLFSDMSTLKLRVIVIILPMY